MYSVIVKLKFDISFHVCTQLELDGRDISVPGYEKGNFVGPTILSGVKVCVLIQHVRMHKQTSVNPV